MLPCVSDPDVNPLYSADTRDPRWYYRAGVADWLRAHGVDPNRVYRYEIYILDTPCMRVFTYAQDTRGKLYGDRETGGIAVCTPYMMRISSFPPSMDLYVTETWPTPYQWSDQALAYGTDHRYHYEVGRP